MFCFYRRLPLRPPFLRVESDGIGVTSSIRPIFIPDRAKALSADWAPGPGVFVLTEQFYIVSKKLMENKHFITDSIENIQW